jgi:hypothetical protein
MTVAVYQVRTRGFWSGRGVVPEFKSLNFRYLSSIQRHPESEASGCASPRVVREAAGFRSPSSDWDFFFYENLGFSCSEEASLIALLFMLKNGTSFLL